MKNPVRSTKKPFLPVIGLLVLVFFLLGMGGGNGGGSDGSSIPLPPTNFTAVLTDQEGVQTRATRLTWEGKIYLQGQYGQAKITVPFNKVKRIQISQTVADDGLSARVDLNTGKQVDLSLERTSKVYAETEFGHMEIFTKDLKLVEFQ